MSGREKISSVFMAGLWMVGTLISFMLMAVGGRELSTDLTTFQILFFRSVIGFIIISTLLLRLGWSKIQFNRIKSHFLRNISHFLGQYGWFYGIAVIPLSEVFAIEFTLPIWTAVFATVILKESLSFNKIIAIIFGIIGVLIILRPGFETIEPAAFVVIGSAISYALSHTLTKKLTKDNTPLTIIFFMTIIQLPIALIPAINNWVTPTGIMWIWIFLVGGTALSAHYCMAKAFILADATTVVPLDFLRLPLIAVVGFIFYDEGIDWLVLIGGGIMLIGNIINLRLETSKAISEKRESIV